MSSKILKWTCSLALLGSIFCVTAGEVGHVYDYQTPQARMDRLHVMNLAESGRSHSLDLADNAQYRFVMTRLAMHGKSAKTNPELFKVLAAERVLHLQRGNEKASQETQSLGTERQEVYEIVELQPESSVYRTSAASTYPDGAYYTFMDVALLDEEGYLLGDANYSEVYDEGEDVYVTSTGTPPITGDVIGDSVKIEDSAQGFNVTYASLRGLDTVPTLDLTSPQTASSNATPFKICLSRNDADCDAYYPESVWKIWAPLEGSATFNYPIDMAAYPTDRLARVFLKLLSPGSGGGCPAVGDQGNPISQDFFRACTGAEDIDCVTITNSNKTFSWRFDPAKFGDDCQLISDKASLSVLIKLPLTIGGNKRQGHLLLNSQGYNSNLPELTVTNSCFAAGTPIRMHDGSLKPIETLVEGDRVLNNRGHQEGLSVVDVITGTEPLPMVRVTAEDGRSLLITEGHPVINVKNEVVLAKYLKVGDTLLTEAGQTTLTSVTREPYDGRVYNLNLGTELEMIGMAKDQTVMYAGGFLVGDNHIQGKYEAKDQVKKGPLLSRLPERWHQDYLLNRKATL